MKRHTLRTVGSGAAAACCLLLPFGCGPKANSNAAIPNTPPIQARPTTGIPPQTAGRPEPSETETIIADAVNHILARPSAQDSANPFPRGTRLLTAHLDQGVASLDFSSEFNALADSGETTESNAQKALRKALSNVPGVDKMRVTVEGKPFQSQATDWNTPFPVKSTDSGAAAADRGGLPGAGGGQ